MVKLRQTTVNWIFNSQGIISFMVTTGSLNNQDMTRILKHEDMISQLNIYVIDIVWILYDICVDVKIHGFVKFL